MAISRCLNVPRNENPADICMTPSAGKWLICIEGFVVLLSVFDLVLCPVFISCVYLSCSFVSGSCL